MKPRLILILIFSVYENWENWFLACVHPKRMTANCFCHLYSIYTIFSLCVFRWKLTERVQLSAIMYVFCVAMPMWVCVTGKKKMHMTNGFTTLHYTKLYNLCVTYTLCSSLCIIIFCVYTPINMDKSYHLYCLRLVSIWIY